MYLKNFVKRKGCSGGCLVVLHVNMLLFCVNKNADDANGGLLRFWFLHNRHTEDQRLSIAFVLGREIRIFTKLFYQKGGLTVISTPT